MIIRHVCTGYTQLKKESNPVMRKCGFGGGGVLGFNLPQIYELKTCYLMTTVG